MSHLRARPPWFLGSTWGSTVGSVIFKLYSISHWVVSISYLFHIYFINKVGAHTVWLCQQSSAPLWATTCSEDTYQWWDTVPVFDDILCTYTIVHWLVEDFMLKLLLFTIISSFNDAGFPWLVCASLICIDLLLLIRVCFHTQRQHKWLPHSVTWYHHIYIYIVAPVVIDSTTSGFWNFW